jgi:hypothetical protein
LGRNFLLELQRLTNYNPLSFLMSRLAFRLEITERK